MNIENDIKKIIDEYRKKLSIKIDSRIIEMKSDNNEHYLIYKLLGVKEKEGMLIDEYQNKGRFLYKYAGSLLEDLTILCLKHKYPNAIEKLKINNLVGLKPKTFEIDCLVNNYAYEIKWRDATTDGDHITKEHTRIKSIVLSGYIPVRIMYYYPNRYQAIKIQNTLETLYKGVKGHYYSGNEAWNFIHKETDIDLLSMLYKLANNN